MLMKDSEEKRNMAWRTVLAISSVLVVMVAAFFVVKLFTSNPLEGTWIREEDGTVMEIREDSTLAVTAAVDGSITVETPYSLDKGNKTFTVHLSEEGIHRQAEASEGSLSEQEIYDILEPLEGTYDYNVEGGLLTLSEREYGSSMVFEAQ